MRTFENGKQAKEYAKTLGKYDSEIVMIGKQKAFVCATTLPIEERFREPIEEAARRFFEEMGYDDSDDNAMYIGAQVSTNFIRTVERETGLMVVCAYLSY